MYKHYSKFWIYCQPKQKVVNLATKRCPTLASRTPFIQLHTTILHSPLVQILLSIHRTMNSFLSSREENNYPIDPLVASKKTTIKIATKLYSIVLPRFISFPVVYYSYTSTFICLLSSTTNCIPSVQAQ